VIYIREAACRPADDHEFFDASLWSNPLVDVNSEHRTGAVEYRIQIAHQSGQQYGHHDATGTCMVRPHHERTLQTQYRYFYVIINRWKHDCNSDRSTLMITCGLLGHLHYRLFANEVANYNSSDQLQCR